MSELASSVPVSQPAVSQHLRVLKEARLVQVHKQAQQRIYSVNPEGLAFTLHPGRTPDLATEVEVSLRKKKVERWLLSFTAAGSIAAKTRKMSARSMKADGTACLKNTRSTPRLNLPPINNSDIATALADLLKMHFRVLNLFHPWRSQPGVPGDRCETAEGWFHLYRSVCFHLSGRIKTEY